MSNGPGPVPMVWTDGGQLSARDRSNLKRRVNSGNPPGGDIAQAAKRLRRLPPPPPAPPAVSGVGVMDVGQGSCVLAYRQNGDPFFYFDIGYPLWFYTRTAPAALNPNAFAYRGPCLVNDPTIILSHWDWDHWRLAKIAHDQGAHGGVDVLNLSWIFPIQPIGPATTNFRNSLTQPTAWPGGLANMPIADGQIVRCTGPANDINNSGLALILPMLLPSDDPDVHMVIFTGDASFGNVPVPAPQLASCNGITAVHHGSDSHGATLNLPNPPGIGRIAYSYGVYQRANGAFFHAYGHPRIPAIAAYQAAGFTAEACTAESTFYQDDGVRGNIRMGRFIAATCPANSCAFQAFPPAKRLD